MGFEDEVCRFQEKREPASINEQIKNVIDGHTEPWGTQVTAVEIEDITLPDNSTPCSLSRISGCRDRGLYPFARARAERHLLALLLAPISF